MNRVGRKDVLKTGEKKAGRPQKEPEKGEAKTLSVMLYQSQRDYLDDFIYKARKEKRKYINRSEILRGILDAVIESDLSLEDALNNSDSKNEDKIKQLIKSKLEL